jgi:hypothetical protein
MLEPVVEKATFLIRNEEKPFIAAASAAMTIRGSFEFHLYRFYTIRRPNIFREIKSSFMCQPKNNQNGYNDFPFSKPPPFTPVCHNLSDVPHGRFPKDKVKQH